MKVAIDGPSGSGKSTVAHALADRCGLTFLDTGAMYRSIGVECAYQGIDPEDEPAVVELARKAKISFGLAEDGTQTVSINGRDVTREIRTPEADKLVTPVSAMAEVRVAMVDQQRKISEGKDVVAEGRDIGTVVFPDAEVKVFLSADAHARALRRAIQRAGGDTAKGVHVDVDPAEVAAIQADLERRDKADSSRAASPLRAAEDAHKIDSSEMSLEEVIETILDLDPRLKEMAS